MLRTLAALALAALAACSSTPPPAQRSDGGSDGGGDGGSDGGSDGGLGCAPGPITLSPSAPALALDGTAPAPTVAFSASSGGPIAAATLSWTVSRGDDTDPGTVANGVFSPYPYAGGVVAVTAADGCGHTGSATVTLTLSAVVNPPAAGVVARFDGTQVPAGGGRPQIVYPNTETRFPRNIYKQLFQWVANGGEHYRVTFTGPGSTVQVYTDGVHPLCAGKNPAAACWESDAAGWTFIASSNAGGTVQVKVESVKPLPDTQVYASDQITIGFSKRDVAGAIFYWSTTAKGVRRANVSDAVPEGYVVAAPVATLLPLPAPSGQTVQCVACHTVSRSGQKMLGGTQTNLGKGMFVYDVELSPPPSNTASPLTAQFREFGTFSPDDAQVIMSNTGKLELYDAATRAQLSPNVLSGKQIGGTQVLGTQPDWSPLGSGVAFATGSGEKPASATSIAVVAHSGGSWGAVSVVATALVGTANRYNLYPSFSPSGDWIAYTRAASAAHGDKTAQLYVAKADGTTASGVELVRANRWLNNQVTSGQYENYMPTWAPSGDYQWVAFNSLRPYGVVYPTGGTQQIWVAAVDLSKAPGADPSYPAFRFSFQDVAEDNHRAFWAQDVRFPTDGGACLADGVPCQQGSGQACCRGTCGPAEGGLYVCIPPIPDGGVDGGTDGGADGGTDGGTDGGACLPVDAGCDQVSGPTCCDGGLCDLGTDGGFFCLPPQTCPVAGEACSPTSPCCPGLLCTENAAPNTSCTTGPCTCVFSG